MSEKNEPARTEREGSGSEVTPEELLGAHPVEPAEGAREPGEDADDPRPPHPAKPAEGER
ncbi:MAG: hypothetical protein ACRDJC_12835 [Thermomicrobiales bacterium]